MITSEPAGVLKIRIPLLSIETMCISLYTVYNLLYHKCLCFCKFKQNDFKRGIFFQAFEELNCFQVQMIKNSWQDHNHTTCIVQTTTNWEFIS